MLSSIFSDATLVFTLMLSYLFIMSLQIFFLSNTQSPLSLNLLDTDQYHKSIEKERYSSTSPYINPQLLAYILNIYVVSLISIVIQANLHQEIIIIINHNNCGFLAYFLSKATLNSVYMDSVPHLYSAH